MEVVEPVVAENLENPTENLENLVDNPETQAVAPRKNGRPAGSKDKVKRVVPSRKKITIVEEPIQSSEPSDASASAPKAVTAPRSRPEPIIEYRDRFVEHSPRSLIRLAHAHVMDAEHARRDARREHFSSMILGRLR